MAEINHFLESNRQNTLTHYTAQFYFSIPPENIRNPLGCYCCLVIIVLELVFRKIKEISNIEGSEIFQKKFIYTVYADDTTFLLKNTESVINLLEIFKHFSHFSGLTSNKSECEIAVIGVLKGLKVALCGMRCVNLHEDTIKILGIHYLYNGAITKFKKSTGWTFDSLELNISYVVLVIEIKSSFVKLHL